MFFEEETPLLRKVGTDTDDVVDIMVVFEDGDVEIDEGSLNPFSAGQHGRCSLSDDDDDGRCRICLDDDADEGSLNPFSAGQHGRCSFSDDDDGGRCRICLDDDADEPLLAPCLCDGGSRYVHASCLMSYFQSPLAMRRREMHRSRAFSCEICSVAYLTRGENDSAQEALCSLLRGAVVYSVAFVATVASSIAVGFGFVLFLRSLPVGGKNGNMCAAWASSNYNIGYGALAIKDGGAYRGEPIGGTSIDFVNISHLPVKIIMFDCLNMSGAVNALVPSELIIYSLLRTGHICFCCWLPMLLFYPRRADRPVNVFDLASLDADFSLSYFQLAAFLITELLAATTITLPPSSGSMALTGWVWLLAAELGLAVMIVTARTKAIFFLSGFLSKLAPPLVSAPTPVANPVRQ
jgi:hypothetical protein